MPRRYESRVNHSTLALNDAKMRMTKNMKQKYRGADATAPQSKHDAREAYDGLAALLAGVESSLQEFVTQMDLTKPTSHFASTRIDVYISATTSLKKNIAGVNAFLDKQYASLSNITQIERDNLHKQSHAIQSLFKQMRDLIDVMGDRRRKAITGVFRSFSEDLMEMEHKLNSIIKPAPMGRTVDSASAFPPQLNQRVQDQIQQHQGLHRHEAAEEERAEEAQEAHSRPSFLRNRKLDEDFWQGTGHGDDDDIDFSKIKWGSFTKAFNAFKKKHGKGDLDNLEDFAKLVLKKGEDFTEKMKDKARFYQNVILKKGGRMGSMYMNRMGSNPNTWSPYTLNHTARVIGGGLPHYEDLDYKMPRRFL